MNKIKIRNPSVLCQVYCWEMFSKKLGTGVNGFPGGCQGLLQLFTAQPVTDGTALLTSSVFILLVVVEDSG